MDAIRPSILLRHLRPTTGSNETTESQYQLEQERLAAKGRRQMDHEARLMATLYPTAQDMQQRFAEQQAARTQQVAAQAADRQRAEQTAAAFTTSRPVTAPPASSRPWEGASMAYSSIYAEREARKQLGAQVAEENRALAAQRALTRQQDRAAEAQQERQLLAQTPCYWNLGATSDNHRFVPTEQRWAAWAPGGSLPASPTAAAAAAPAAINSSKRGLVLPPYALHTESARGGAPGSLSTSSSSVAHGSRSGSYKGLVAPYATLAATAAPAPAPAAPATRRFPWEWDA